MADTSILSPYTLIVWEFILGDDLEPGMKFRSLWHCTFCQKAMCLWEQEESGGLTLASSNEKKLTWLKCLEHELCAREASGSSWIGGQQTFCEPSIGLGTYGDRMTWALPSQHSLLSPRLMSPVGSSEPKLTLFSAPALHKTYSPWILHLRS